MRSVKYVAVAAIAVAVALSTGPAFAASGSIALIAPWGNAAFNSGQVTVTYSISASPAVPATTVDAVQAAIDHWNNCLDMGHNNFSEMTDGVTFVANDSGCGTLPTNHKWRFAQASGGAPLVKIMIKKGGGTIAGQTFTKFDSSGFVAGDRVQISGSSFGVSDDQVVFNIAAHELGHVVGLGHSNVSTDLMYPTINGNVNFGSCEINGVDALYYWLPGGVLPPSPPPGPVSC